MQKCKNVPATLFGFLIICTIYTNILVLCRCDLSMIFLFCFVSSDQTYETWSDSSDLIYCNWTFVFEKLQLQFWCKVVIKFLFRIEPGFGKTLILHYIVYIYLFLLYLAFYVCLHYCVCSLIQPNKFPLFLHKCTKSNSSGSTASSGLTSPWLISAPMSMYLLKVCLQKVLWSLNPGSRFLVCVHRLLTNKVYSESDLPQVSLVMLQLNKQH